MHINDAGTFGSLSLISSILHIRSFNISVHLLIFLYILLEVISLMQKFYFHFRHFCSLYFRLGRGTVHDGIDYWKLVRFHFVR